MKPISSQPDHIGRKYNRETSYENSSTSDPRIVKLFDMRGDSYKNHGGPQSAGSIEIPYTSHGGDDDTTIEIGYEDLSDDIDDVLQALREEKARLHYWVTIAKECYRRRYYKAFERLLDTARVEANINYDKSDEDRVGFCFTLVL